MVPPAGFDDLSTAYNAPKDTFVNIIGVVVDLMPPTRTSVGQHIFTFKLLDERLRDAAYGSQGLTVRFFVKDISSLPRVRQVGDVVLLRMIKMMAYNQQPLALSNYQTGVLVFPSASIPDPKFQIAYNDKKRIECHGVPLDVEKLNLQEQAYVIELKQAMSAYVSALPGGRHTVISTQQSAPQPLATAARVPPLETRKRSAEDVQVVASKRAKSATFGEKFHIISDTHHYMFADICAQVVRKFPSHFGTCELYVTDYTENKDMFLYRPPEDPEERERDGDTYGYTGPPKKDWTGPWGQLVLKVNLKDPHANYANRQVEQGDLVLLRNVKMKMRDGSKLEGDMWPDDMNPEKVQIRKMIRHELEPPEIKELMGRKERYWAARERKAVAREKAERPKMTETERKKEKAARKKEKKQRDLEKAAALAEPGQRPKTKGQSKADLNPNVRCSHEEVPISTIRDILDPDDKRHKNTTPDGITYALPFVNAKYRARVRVVGFSPERLEDFAVSESVDDDDKSENSLQMDWESSPKYHWSFSLTLQDASRQKSSHDSEDHICVNLGHEEATYLLGNTIEDPVDLRTDARALARLRDKLFLLWGNLEEVSNSDTLSNRPFECCLMEYGVEMDDVEEAENVSSVLRYQRLYRLNGVTIL